MFGLSLAAEVMPAFVACFLRPLAWPAPILWLALRLFPSKLHRFLLKVARIVVGNRPRRTLRCFGSKLPGKQSFLCLPLSLVVCPSCGCCSAPQAFKQYRAKRNTFYHIFNCYKAEAETELCRDKFVEGLQQHMQ
jgi:hypothetical protein